MLNKEFIKENINNIYELLDELKPYKKYTLQEITEDFHLYASLRYAFIELVGRAVDINQHIIKENNLKVPKDYKDTFTLLVKIKILTRKFAEEISKSVGLRNVVTHEYRDIEDKILYDSIDIALKQYSAYCENILKYL